MLHLSFKCLKLPLLLRGTHLLSLENIIISVLFHRIIYTWSQWRYICVYKYTYILHSQGKIPNNARNSGSSTRAQQILLFPGTDRAESASTNFFLFIYLAVRRFCQFSVANVTRLCRGQSQVYSWVRNLQ